ncbi:MAG: pilus assembly protein [Caldilineaceae bacterium]|nr:pilus assembly protein [Caldilineaceae bacterium]MBP8107363.1 pilus assembly protein [Caldilineaceae bacterium]MBP8124286.1 pilus assembly protein [Caldilineaceae bacterium]MBP9074266.1 pilus assembly protein [Caldilineaceae bacterium]
MAAEIGQAMVETAMVIMVLMLLLMGIFDFGRVVVIYASMTAAAQDAAHMGALTSNTGVIQTTAIEGTVMAVPTVTVVRTTTYTNVTVTTTFRPITPFISVFTGSSGIVLTQSARVAILGTVVSP